MGTIVTMI